MTFSKVVKKYISLCLTDRKSYFISLFLIVISSILIKTIPIFYGAITQAILGNVLEMAIWLVVGLFLIKIIGESIQVVGNQFTDNVLLTAFKSARLAYIHSLQDMDYDYHTNKSSGSLISLAKRGEAALFSALVEVNNAALTALLQFLVAIVALSYIHIYLGLMVLFFLIVTIIAGYLLIRFNVNKRKKANEEDDKITALTVDNLVGFETVKIFAKEKFELKRFENVYVPWRKAQQEYILTFRIIDIVISLLSGLSILFTTLIMIYSVRDNVISIGQAVAGFVYVFDLGLGMNMMIFRVREIAKNYTDLQKYFEIIDLNPTVKDPEQPKSNDLIKGNIEFKNLSFEYPRSKIVLNNLNIKINQGETIALVGESGSGKTTLGRLLLRFYDPQSGAVLIDGINAKEFNQSDLRLKIGVVPQEPILFNDSIAFNISYGKPEASLEEIYEAAKKSELHDFIQSLQSGYDTIVGERGIKLSGGQKQRLAIARVILENPPIVLFDEATSQLDSATEKSVQAAFENLTKNKTTIIIAHRLSTVKSANRILVFDKGKVVEEGKHSDLIKNSQIYKNLWELQTDSYIDVE